MAKGSKVGNNQLSAANRTPPEPADADPAAGTASGQDAPCLRSSGLLAKPIKPTRAQRVEGLDPSLKMDVQVGAWLHGHEQLTLGELLLAAGPVHDLLFWALRGGYIPEPYLHELACRYAEHALLKARAGIDPCCSTAIAAKRAWILGGITKWHLNEARKAAELAARTAPEEWALAAEAAWVATWPVPEDAAWLAARSATQTAAWEAGWAAIWPATQEVAREAAWVAARSIMIVGPFEQATAAVLRASREAAEFAREATWEELRELTCEYLAGIPWGEDGAQ